MPNSSICLVCCLSSIHNPLAVDIGLGLTTIMGISPANRGSPSFPPMMGRALIRAICGNVVDGASAFPTNMIVVFWLLARNLSFFPSPPSKPFPFSCSTSAAGKTSTPEGRFYISRAISPLTPSSSSAMTVSFFASPATRLIRSSFASILPT